MKDKTKLTILRILITLSIILFILFVLAICYVYSLPYKTTVQRAKDKLDLCRITEQSKFYFKRGPNKKVSLFELTTCCIDGSINYCHQFAPPSIVFVRDATEKELEIMKHK